MELSEVKNYLNITYEDEDIDRKLEGIVRRAESHIREVTAAEVLTIACRLHALWHTGEKRNPVSALFLTAVNLVCGFLKKKIYRKKTES